MIRSPAQQLDILLIGCGKMGSAMAEGWLKAGLVKSLIILEPYDLPAAIAQNSSIIHYRDISSLKQDIKADCALIAVKPQMMREVCTDIKTAIDSATTIISIAAGTPISLFEDIFGKAQPVIRTMPNTPAAIGKGMSVAMSNAHVTAEDRSTAEILLQVCGKLRWVSDENLFHAVTALSGSGPAYVFLLIETMTKAGIAMGLDQQTAQTLARQTVIGSAALAEHDEDTEASQLRKNVTSPGGTTEAALKVLMDGRLDDLFTEGLKAAQNRSKELAAG